MSVVIASLNPAIERLLVVPRNEPGTVHRLSRSETLAGGKGVNVARVLAQLATPAFTPRAGADTGDTTDAAPAAPAARAAFPVPPTLLVGPLGGPTGRLQAELLAAEGLATATVPISGWTRTNEVLLDESRPEHATVYNAAGPALDPDELAALRTLCSSALDGASLLICTGSLPPGPPVEFYGEWIAEARRRGIRTLLDADGTALARGAAAGPTIVKVNRDELRGLAVADGRTERALVDAWHATGTEAVIVTDGAAATEAHTPEGDYTVRSPRVPTRSAVGSGDAFTAGLVWSLLERPAAGWPEHLALAAACGASNAASTLARLSPEHPPAALLPAVDVQPVQAAPATPGTAAPEEDA